MAGILNDKTDPSGFERILVGIASFGLVIFCIYKFTLEFILSNNLNIFGMILTCFYGGFMIYNGATARKRLSNSKVLSIE